MLARTKNIGTGRLAIVLKRLISAATLVVLGSVVALLLTESGLRIAYVHLPGGMQDMLQDVRLWGAGGRRLGPSWLEYCVADDYLIARNQPDLNRAWS